MYRKVLFSVLLIVMSNNVSSQQLVTDKDIKMYKSFLKAGTTMGLLAAFLHPEKWKSVVDTTLAENISKETTNHIIELFNSKDVRKHHQQKIGGVLFGGEVMYGGQKHYFIFCEGNILIDLTARLTYRQSQKK